MAGSGTKDDPWELTTPPGSSQYQMYRDTDADPPTLVSQVGSTQLRHHLRAVRAADEKDAADVRYNRMRAL